MQTHSHESDFLRWIEEQAALLRSGRFDEADIGNILEEIESMGKEQKVALQSLFRQIMIHLLKLEFSTATAPRIGWIEEISEFRDQAESRIEETPSLKHHAECLFSRAWMQARRSAAKFLQAYGEQIDIPTECPYSFEEVMDNDYLPSRSAAAHR